MNRYTSIQSITGYLGITFSRRSFNPSPMWHLSPLARGAIHPRFLILLESLSCLIFSPAQSCWRWFHQSYQHKENEQYSTMYVSEYIPKRVNRIRQSDQEGIHSPWSPLIPIFFHSDWHSSISYYLMTSVPASIPIQKTWFIIGNLGHQVGLHAVMSSSGIQ